MVRTNRYGQLIGFPGRLLAITGGMWDAFWRPLNFLLWPIGVALLFVANLDILAILMMVFPFLYVATFLFLFALLVVLVLASRLGE